MQQNVKYVAQNNVRNRLLPLTKSVELGLESEPEMADFNVLKELGEGSFGKVLLVQHKKTNAKYALKVVDKQHVLTEPDKSSFLREVEINYKINHLRQYIPLINNSIHYLQNGQIILLYLDD